MDCFKVRLVLRQNHHCPPRELSQAIFDHLSLCRGCWAYADQLWQQEALDLNCGQLDVEAQALRLEAAWTRRQDPKPALSSDTFATDPLSPAWPEGEKFPS